MNHLWCEKGAYYTKKARAFCRALNRNDIKKITVIRHAAFGDQVITRPFLVELRRFFPNASITLSLIDNYTYAAPTDLVDNVHIISRKNMSLAEKIKQINALGEQDIIFDLANTSRSHFLTLLTKAKIKIGFPYKPIHQRLIYDIAILRSDFHPEVECMLAMLNFFGCVPEYPLNFAYPDHRQIADSKQPYIVYFTGASVESKRYPDQLFKKLITQACDDFPNFQHVLLEGINANEKGQYFTDLTKAHPNFRIQPALSLEELTPFIAKAQHVIGNDSGIRNLAIATHTPTIGIFMSTVPFRYWPRYEPGHVVIANPNGEMPIPSQILAGLEKSVR